MNFGEEVGWLIFRGDRNKTNCFTSHMLSNKVTINFDVFGSFMENIIVNLNNTSIITLETSQVLLRYAHV